MPKPARVPKHGTLTQYATYRCRCAECREAFRIYQRGYRFSKGLVLSPQARESHNLRVKLQHGTKPPVHGQVSRGYRRGCRCDECCAAKSRQYVATKLRDKYVRIILARGKL